MPLLPHNVHAGRGGLLRRWIMFPLHYRSLRLYFPDQARTGRAKPAPATCEQTLFPFTSLLSYTHPPTSHQSCKMINVRHSVDQFLAHISCVPLAHKLLFNLECSPIACPFPPVYSAYSKTRCFAQSFRISCNSCSPSWTSITRRCSWVHTVACLDS